MENNQNPADFKDLADTTKEVVTPTWGASSKLPTPGHNGSPAPEDEPEKTDRKSPSKSLSKGKVLGSLFSKTSPGKIVQGAELIYKTGEQLYDHWTGDENTTPDKTTGPAPKPYYQQQDEWVEDQVDLIDRYGPQFVFGDHNRGMSHEAAGKQLEKGVKRDIHYQISRQANAPAPKHEWQERLDAAKEVHQRVIDHSYVADSPGEKLQYLVHQHRLNLADDMKLNRVYQPKSALYASKQAVQQMHKAGYGEDEIRDALSDTDPQMAGWSTRDYLMTRGIAKTYLKEATADLKNPERRFYLDQERDRIAAWRTEQNIAPSDRRTPKEYDKAISRRLETARYVYETTETQPIPKDFEHKAEFMRLLGHEYSAHGDKVREWNADPQRPHAPETVTQRVACRMYVAGFEREEIHEAIRTFDIKTEGWSKESVNYYLHSQIDPVLDAAEPDRQQMTLWKQQRGIGHVRWFDVFQEVHQLEEQELENPCEQPGSQEMSLDDYLFE